MASFDQAQVDPSKNLLECRALVMHFGGGIRVDMYGETNIPGLLAAGFCAGFPGAAEGLSGGMLAICCVFGFRAGAGAGAAKQAQGTKQQDIIKDQLKELEDSIRAPLKRTTQMRAIHIYRRLNKRLVEPDFSVVKEERTIREMLSEIRNTTEEELPQVSALDIHELIKTNEVRNFVQMLELIYVSALERRETRLCHYRKDYPFRDDVDWLKWIVVRRSEKDIEVRFEPVPIEKYLIQPRARVRVIHPIQF